MRREIATVGCMVLVGCGSSISDSGGAPPDDAPPVNQGQTPDDNAKQNPPIGGSAPSGVYVSSSLGNDLATGSIKDPFKTLAAAMALAKAQNLPLNACAETYAEAVTLVDGVSVYGYLDCKNNWVRGSTNATIASPTSPALIAKSISLPTRFAGFDVRAPDFDANTSADAAAPASIALSVSDSTNLTFTSILAHAGKGAQGVDGNAAVANIVTSYTVPPFVADQGNPCGNSNPLLRPIFCNDNSKPATTSGSPGGTAKCTLGEDAPAGGKGGAPRIFLNGSVPANAAPGPINGQNGAGPSPGVGGVTVGNRGGNGANGGVGVTGADGNNGQWLLTADGFTVGNGIAGGNGGPGSGGGGGGATPVVWNPANAQPTSPPNSGYYVTGSGAAGGVGGCAGQAGTPGTGGGASIAALVVQSSVTFEQSHLESSAGGRAGKGALGTPGTAGQQGAAGLTERDVIGGGTAFNVTGNGGNGGDGGRGGVSGHGAPGPSIALAYTGTRPTLTTTDLAPGPAGEGQPALTGVGTVPAVAGVSEAEHAIQ